MSPQTNLETAFVQNAKRVQNSQGREFDSFSCETPPGYEESLYRQRLLKLHHRSSSYIAPSPVNLVPDKIIEKQVLDLVIISSTTFKRLFGKVLSTKLEFI